MLGGLHVARGPEVSQACIKRSSVNYVMTSSDFWYFDPPSPPPPVSKYPSLFSLRSWRHMWTTPTKHWPYVSSRNALLHQHMEGHTRECEDWPLEYDGPSASGHPPWPVSKILDNESVTLFSVYKSNLHSNSISSKTVLESKAVFGGWKSFTTLRNGLDF